MRTTIYSLILLLPCYLVWGAGPPTFEADVRPIFKANCFHCHGEEKELKGDLDLRFRKQMVAAKAIQPGASGKSKLYELVASGEMPPKEEHRLSAEDVATIARWIDRGAKAGPEPQEIPAPGAFVMTAAERTHWAFQPIKSPPVDFGDEHPIDFFVRRRLRAADLDFSPPASRRQLIRRAYFDLLGLPPSPEEMKRHLAGDHDRMIDELLANQHYGERWARHWLDIAGYADSEGYNDQDTIRKGAWHYRDYVIRAHNDDLPWDQFITEQLAGDELAGATAENARFLARDDPEAFRLMTATGFLRMGPDGTGSKPDDLVAARNAVITETVKIVSSSLLGMTIGCAECHHHRFDPIPQEDFYALRSVFAPVYDTAAWRTPSQRRIGVLSTAEAATYSKYSKLNEAAKKNRLARMQEVVRIIFDRELKQVPEARRDFARKTFATPAKERTKAQVALFEKEYPSLNVSTSTLHLFVQKYEDSKELMESYEKFKKESEEAVAKMPKSRDLRAATEVSGAAPVTRVFYRGDPGSPEGEPIAPRGLTAVGAKSLAWPEKLPTSGRRLAYAKHLTDGHHPLVARVLVNRFWKHHFGRGLVESPDFGSRGDPPSHPELLDWLAADFMANGWKLKRLHKLVMTSRTYQQSSTRRSEAEQVDADNRLLWRMPVRRLEAEAVRDSILAVSGSLQRDLHGEPLPVAASAGGLFSVKGDRRAIYIQARRTQPVSMLEVFDAPDMEPNCEQRVSSTVTTQSLAIMNGEFVRQQAQVMAERIAKEAESPSARARQSLLRAFGREPDADELSSLESYLADQTKLLGDDRKALASLCQVLMGANEFLYID